MFGNWSCRRRRGRGNRMGQGETLAHRIFAVFVLLVYGRIFVQ